MMFYTGLVVLQALLWTNVCGILPMWKNLLNHHRVWEGRYTHTDENSILYDCSLTVASIGLTEDSKSYVYLTADRIEIDMSISTDDDIIIYLEEEAVWKKIKVFENHTDIRIAGQFVRDHLYYMFIGNVSSAEEENFASLGLRPRGFSQIPYHEPKSTHLKYALVYGIPVSCAVVLMITGVGILCWAVRKGYVRSLSWAYKNFKNPPEEPQPALELRGSSDPVTSEA